MIAEAWARAKTRAEAEQASKREYELRGNNLAVQGMIDEEILLVGAAGTGKTLAILNKINAAMWQYPRARALIVRKVRADLAQTVLVTFERDILGFDNPICAGAQRAHRMSYKYPNGSEIVIGGMDRPGAVLSGEYDLIYPAEATQFTLEDWETLVMRNRNGVMPFQQVIGDTNPDRPDHWLKQRADVGLVKLLNTFHQDNPRYFDLKTNDWTDAGRDYVLGKLHRLTGVRRARFLEGKWIIAEGVIYEDWNEAIHLIDRFDIPADWRRFRSIDFGYVHPFVCSWFAQDPDGHLYRYREIYKTKRLVEDHARHILQLSEGENIEFTVADHDAEGRATLNRYGIRTIPAKKDVLEGIQAVQARLRVWDDKKPGIMYLRDSLVERDLELEDAKKPTCTEQEFGGYIWSDKTSKEQPVKEDDDGMDTTRYGVAAVDLMRRAARVRRDNPFFG